VRRTRSALWHAIVVLAVAALVGTASADKRGAAFAGIVCGPGGEGVAGATVFLALAEQPVVRVGPAEEHAFVPYRTSTAHDGRFRVQGEDIPPEMQRSMDAGRDLRVWATAAGVVTPSRSVLAQGDEAMDLRLVLTPEASITVRVRRGDVGLGNVSVCVDIVRAARAGEGAAGLSYGIEGRTNAEGEFRASGLPTGTYGEPSAEVVIQGRTMYLDDRECSLVQAGRTIDVAIRLPLLRVVRGSVVDADGKPALGLLVTACSRNSTEEDPVEVSGSGEFELRGVPIDAWSLVVCTRSRSEGPFRFPKAIAVKSLQDQEGTSDLDVGPIVAPRLRDVAVTTVDGAGHPLRCAVEFVLTDAESCMPTASAWTSDLGELVWRNVAEGGIYEAVVHAHLEPWGEVEQHLPASVSGGSLRLRVTGEGFLIARFWTDQKPRLRAPVRAPWVLWEGRSSSMGAGNSDTSSEFRLWVDPGDVGVLSVDGRDVKGASEGTVEVQRGQPTVVDVVVHSKAK
jgi:hypothetical protein